MQSGSKPAPRGGGGWAGVGWGERGRYQILKDLLHLCDKGKEASDEGNCKGTRLTFLYIVGGGSEEERSKGKERRLWRGREDA